MFYDAVRMEGMAFPTFKDDCGREGRKGKVIKRRERKNGKEKKGKTKSKNHRNEG